MATATSVEALAPGDHACLTFSDPDERLDIVAAFGELKRPIAAAASAICDAALSLPAGRVMSILCDGGVLQMLGLVGTTEIRVVRVVSTHGER